LTKEAGTAKASSLFQAIPDTEPERIIGGSFKVLNACLVQVYNEMIANYPVVDIVQGKAANK
jgi:hypothetical protein